MSTLSTKPIEPLGQLGPNEKNKQWQRELLMERLRSHSTQHKTFQELSKAMRMSMLEKRYALDAVEKSNLQKCLDSMQHCIKVTNRQGLVERLESLSRQLGLKFMEDTSGLFISSDMFYLEIIIDHNGILSDVKVHHECKIEQQSCSELVNCLMDGDFADFTIQLEGLSSIYQLNAEPKVKSKAFVALQAMETDLYNMFTIQNYHKDTLMMLMESTVGMVQKRRGGHPMKLTYFIPPYDLLSLESKTMLPLNIDLIATKSIGMSVTVNLEASSANKLQILPTVSFNQDQQGVSMPIYAPMTATNSTLLPATFVLRLNKPLPVCDSLKQTIMYTPDSSNLWDNKGSTSIMQLIVQTASEGQIQNATKGLFVPLPDQTHCYFFTENRKMRGSIVTNVPFTEPSQVPKILSVLKRQALFHTLLGSCVRSQGKIGDLESTIMLEVNATSIYQISVSMQHPFEESMATIEFDLSDATNVLCRVYSLANSYDVISVKLSKIAQISLSIPVTVRALLKYWEQERLKNFHRGLENGNYNLPLGPSDPGGRGNDLRDMKTKTERNMNGNFSNSNRQFFHPSGVMMNSNSETFSSDNNINLFNNPNETVMMNQFALKSANDINFGDVGAIKGYQTGEDFCKSPKSNLVVNCPQFSKNSDSSSLGTSLTSDSGVATHAYHNVLHGSQENALIPGNSNDGTIKKCDDLSNRDDGRQTGISITPVPSAEMTSVLSGMGLDKRHGIEIIPITATNSSSLPTSITITPVNPSKTDKKSNTNKKYDDKSKSEKKRKRKKDELPMGPPEKLASKQDNLSRPSGGTNLKNSDSTSSKLSPKLSSFGSNTKSSSKNSPAYSSPKYLSSGMNSPKNQYGITSPKHGSSTSSGKPSMSALKSVTNSLSPKSERSKGSYKDKDKDRNSKLISGGGSPKIKSSTVKLKQVDLSSTFLPSQQQGYFDDSSGNSQGLLPSESSAGSSTSSCSSFSSGNSSANSQAKARKSSLNAVIDKLKSAQNSAEDFPSIGQVSMLKSCDPDGNLSRDKFSSSSNTNKLQGSGSSSFKSSSSGGSFSSNVTPSEYMIKPSLDGMKITINKKKEVPFLSYKSSPPSAGTFSKISSPSGSGSPKKNTGLKPGVSSGPASKKSSQQSSSKSASNLASSTSGNAQSRGTFQKSHSSGSLSSKGSATTKGLGSSGFSDGFRKDKSNKTKGSLVEKPTPPPPTDIMKILRFASPNNAMEGFMKSLNTKFQIPKLSARNSDDSKKDVNRSNSSSAPATPVSTSTSSPPINSTTTTMNSTSSSDLIGRNFVETPSKIGPSKYPFPLSQQSSGSSNNILNKVPYNTTIPTLPHGKDLTKSSSSDTIPSMQKDPISKPYSSTTATPMHMTFSTFSSSVSNTVLNSTPIPRASPTETAISHNQQQTPQQFQQQSQQFDIAMRPPSAPCAVAPSAPCAVDMSKNSELDLSMKNSETNRNSDHRSTTNPAPMRKVPSTTQKMSFPSSPSVSLHIVKSPVPSPLVMPSPHSNSPCITDDELMDEALVGIGGK